MPERLAGRHPLCQRCGADLAEGVRDYRRPDPPGKVRVECGTCRTINELEVD